MKWYAISGNLIFWEADTKEELEAIVDFLCTEHSDLFVRKYITIMSAEDYEKETF